MHDTNGTTAVQTRLGGSSMTDACASIYCGGTPEVIIELIDGRERPVCAACAKRDVRRQDAKVVGHV